MSSEFGSTFHFWLIYNFRVHFGILKLSRRVKICNFVQLSILPGTLEITLQTWFSPQISILSSAFGSLFYFWVISYFRVHFGILKLSGRVKTDNFVQFSIPPRTLEMTLRTWFSPQISILSSAFGSLFYFWMISYFRVHFGILKLSGRVKIGNFGQLSILPGTLEITLRTWFSPQISVSSSAIGSLFYFWMISNFRVHFGILKLSERVKIGNIGQLCIPKWSLKANLTYFEVHT